MQGMEEIRASCYIDGEWMESGERRQSIDPSTGDVVGSFVTADTDQVQQAIAAARRAYDESAWSSRPRLRARILLEVADRLEHDQERLAHLLASENGKPLAGARHEILAGISEFRYYAGLTRTIFGRMLEVEDGLHAWLAREPIGVAGIIVPWNAPVTLLVRSLAPALAAGCTAVVKCAPQTALISHAMFEHLTAGDGLPRGVLNLFTEFGSEGSQILVASPEVDIISYTGSTRTGKSIMEAASGTLKELSLELGGSAPVVIHSDADLDRMVPDIARAGTMYAGQMCTAPSRLIVHTSRLDEVQSRLAMALKQIVVGPALAQGTHMGPMIDVPNRDRVRELVAEAARSDEVVLLGEVPGGELSVGAFLEPSLVAVRTPDSPLLRDEVFGPALSLDSFTDEEEAITKANNTRYGLAASVWSQDLQRALRTARAVRAGSVWINGHNRLMAEAETGGYKESGVGRLHGVEGLETFLQTKHISFYLSE